MIIGMAVIGCSFVYTSIIAIIYFSKKKVNNFETKIYNVLIILSLLNMLIEITLCVNVLLKIDLYSFYNMFLNRLFLVALFTWLTIFTIYIFKISFSNNENYERIFNRNGWGHHLFALFIYACLIAVLILPIYQYNDGIFSYSYGPAPNALIIIYIVYFIIWFLFLMFKTNKTAYVKYTPLFLVVAFSGIALLLRHINPGILLNSLPFSFAVLILFFTIENPDLKMLREMELAKEMAEKSNRAKSDFLSSVSHEIRTPLNAIVGLSQLNENAKNLEEAKETSKDIVNASNVLLDIVGNVLDMSKIESGNIEIIESYYNPYEMLENIVKIVDYKFKEKGLLFKIKIAPDLPNFLYGDQGSIKKVIINLLSNAAKYTKEGHVIFTINVINKDDVSRLIISVEDTGKGIKPEHINKLFTKFDRLDEEKNTTTEGTGLGLAITKSLVELMHGTITVQSVYGSGSKFMVIFDQKNKLDGFNTTEIIKEKPVKEVYDFKQKRILVVDDNPMNLKVAGRFLNTYNCEVTLVECAEECLDIIDAGEVFDLVLADEMMPSMSGTQMMKILKGKKYKVPIVVLTADVINSAKEKFLASGFDDYLGKPIEKLELERVLKKYLS